MSSIRGHARLLALIALVLVAAALVGRALPDPGAAAPVDFAPQAILADAATLASERFERRGAGSAGLEAAADHIAERLRACGVASAVTPSA